MNPHYRRTADGIINNVIARAKSAEAFTHLGMRGRARELFTTELLTPFLSPNIGVCTGIVVDSRGSESDQIDIIIYDKGLIPPIMLSQAEGVVPVESVLATIEVKSVFTRAEVRSAIHNARSIKALHTDFREATDRGPASCFGVGYKSSVLCCLFGFVTDQDIIKECGRIRDLVEESNKDLEPKNRVLLPLSAICVGNEIAIQPSIAGWESPIVANYTEVRSNAALHFLSFLVDQLAIMEVQRRKMFMSQYFLDDPWVR